MLMDFKIGKYWEKAKSEIVDSIREDYTPHETAFSFALGTFIVLYTYIRNGSFHSWSDSSYI